MSTYFVSGHRDLTLDEFNNYYEGPISEVFYDYDCDEHTFIVGDCKGTDQMAAEYIADKIKEKCLDECSHPELVIYHMGEEPRFRIGEYVEEHDDWRININEDEDIDEEDDEYIGPDEWPVVEYRGGYDSDVSRDTAMTNHSSFDIAFCRKNKKLSGTAQNIFRRHAMD